jgi:hypothetical protein
MRGYVGNRADLGLVEKGTFPALACYRTYVPLQSCRQRSQLTAYVMPAL